jgi:hypothetical protein
MKMKKNTLEEDSETICRTKLQSFLHNEPGSESSGRKFLKEQSIHIHSQVFKMASPIIKILLRVSSLLLDNNQA